MRYFQATLLLLALLCTSPLFAQVAKEEEPDKMEFIQAASEPIADDTLSKYLEYPEVAKRAGIEGTVEVSALIGTDGSVLRVKIERSSNAMFEKPAFRAMQRMRYKPAMSNGKPVRTWVKEKILFKLNH